MPPRYNNQHVRAQLRMMEEHIRQRSRAAENRWSLDKYAVNVAGSTINRVLGALDSLDRHCFDRVDSNNSLDTLYNKIFGSSKETTNENPSSNSSCSSSAYPGNNSSSSSSSNNAANNSDEAIVRTLCEWAVSVQRCGEHRALVVARLLEKRQNNLSQAENDMPDEKDSVTSNQMATPGGCTFQGLLLKFLDTQAPVYGEPPFNLSHEFLINVFHIFLFRVK